MGTRGASESSLLPSQFAAIAIKVREFFAERAFGGPVDLDDPKVVRAMSQPLARFVTEKFFVRALARVAVAAREPTLAGEPNALSTCPPFPWSGEVHLSKRSVFPKVPCDNKYELGFAKWLDGCDEVPAWAKVPMRFSFSIEYLDDDFNLRNYHPDWVARTAEGLNLLIETKGQEGAEVAAKSRAAAQWCENVTTLTRQPWRFLKVPQKAFEQNHPSSLTELFALFSERGVLDLVPPARAQLQLLDPLDALSKADRDALHSVYALVAEEKPRKAVSRIFDLIDDHMLAGETSECERILEVVDVRRLEARTALAFLSVTNPSKGSLSARRALLARIEEFLLGRFDQHYVETLLGGLR